MDTTVSLSDVLAALQFVVSNTPVLKDRCENTGNSTLTGTGSGSRKHHPILPAAIQSLPAESYILPDSNAAGANGIRLQQQEEDERQEAKTRKPLSDLAAHLTSTITPNLNLSSLSPNYYGFVTGGACPPALLADFVTSIYDQNLVMHLPADTIATEVEVAALEMVRQLFWLPVGEWGVGGRNGTGGGGEGGGGGGTITSGATASNVLGMALGREYVLSRAVEKRTGQKMSCGEFGVVETMLAAGVRRIQVLSSMPHSTTRKAASLVGIGRANVVSVAKEDNVADDDGDDGGWEIDLERLRTEAGREGVVSILSVSAGEVNTGRYATTSSEMMKQIRDICDEFGVWLHVDGAFGLFGRVLMNSEHKQDYEQIVQGVAGLELADSITGDGHKLLNVPYDCGLFYTRHRTLSEAVFTNGTAAYLNAAAAGSSALLAQGIQNPMNIGIENSRRFRALPVYAALRTYGREGYVDMLRRQIGLARRVTAWLQKHPAFEVLPRSVNNKEALAKTFMIVLFRATDPALNKDMVKRINASGLMYVTGTSWGGQPAARMAVSNWQVDVERDGKLIEDVLAKLTA